MRDFLLEIYKKHGDSNYSRQDLFKILEEVDSSEFLKELENCSARLRYYEDLRKQ